MQTLSQSDSLHPPTMAAPAWRFITPSMAANYLSIDNRKIKPSVVKEYARLMRNGLFIVSPHGITIGIDGKAIDGNHRLHALHSLGQAVAGYWFLVAEWPVTASDLRVDRGSQRSLADFSKLIPKVATVITAIATILSIGNGSRRDPSEMAPLVEAFAKYADRLHAECPTNRRGRSSATVRAGFVAAMVSQPDAVDYIASQYRALVLNTADMSSSMRILGNQLDTQRMETHAASAKAFDACLRPHMSRLQFNADTLTVLRNVFRNYLNAQEAQ